MSVQAMSWVFDHSPTTLGPRLVLLSIANHAKDDGTGAWPSLAALAAESRMSERHVRRCLRELEIGGHLTCEVGAGPKGTNLYDVVLLRDDTLSPGQDVPRTKRTDGGDISVARGDTHVPRTIKNRPKGNRPKTLFRKRVAEPYSEAFEKFWASYPLRKDKRHAFVAFGRALERASLDELIAGAERYAADPARDPDKTKYAEGWLNGDRWLDEAPASAALALVRQRMAEGEGA